MINKLRKVKRWYHQYGFKLLIRKILDRQEEDSVDYINWKKRNEADKHELERQSKEKFFDDITISIAVPVYHTPKKYLCEMIESVCRQTYSQWELCIADGSNDERLYDYISKYAKQDQRIKIQKLERNLGIAGNTNAAVSMCIGAYIGFLDHDDTLAPEALYQIRDAIQRNQYPDILYTDEDKMSMNGEKFYDPHFKSDYNKELLRSNNYICHFFVTKKDIIDQVGGFRKKYEGAQDYDFILRCTEVAENIVHIAKPLYHWRCHAESTAENPESKLYAYRNGKKAIEAHLKRQGESGCVQYTKDMGFYHVKYKLLKSDKVTIIIFDNDRISNKDVSKCIKSIKQTIGYSYYDIFSLKSLSEFDDKNISGDYVLFINSTVSLITYNWMTELLGYCQKKDTGAVGIKLYNRNETIRHAGIIANMKGYAFEGMPRVRSGYFHRDSMSQNLNAVSIDFMMIPSSLLIDLRRTDCNILYNERRLCEKIRNKGKKIIYNPFVEAYIKGSSSRVACYSEKKDEFYNENFELVSPGYRIIS
ncbi:MAG: glycosyltransferase [Lachnospiraceae bacterium]